MISTPPMVGVPAFFWCDLRAFLADVLADLKLAQLADQPRPQRDAQEQRREAGESRAERDVAEDAERADVAVKLFVEEEVEHATSVYVQKPFQRPLHAHAARTLEQDGVAGARHAGARTRRPRRGPRRTAPRPPARLPPPPPPWRARRRARRSANRFRARRRSGPPGGAVPRRRGPAPASRPAPRCAGRAGVSRSTSIMDCAASGLEL